MKFEQGQTVILLPARYERNVQPREVQIARVARKYAYVDLGYAEVGFDLETGREKGAVAAGAGREIRTAELHARVQRRHRAEQRLSELGVRPKNSNRFAYSVEALERIIEVLEHDAQRENVTNK